MRNLTKAIAAVTILAPVTANPLGLGDIKLHSALNQNLDAEIALVLSADENASDLQVRLAPPEKFDEAGVPWNYFLSKIKFETVVQADGSTIIKLSSNEAYREPFLDFLLEVSWVNGSLYREFTVLVDPPVAYTQSVIPVVQKAKQEEKLEVAEIIVVEEEITKDSTDVVAEVIFNQAPDQYGPTKSADTLWRIAENSNTYDDVSIEQMIMAIYEANPKAFYKDNINAMMAGQTLVIPEKEVILKLSRKQALTAFKQQGSEWAGLVAVKPKQQVSVPDSTEIDAKLELEAPVKSEIAETVTVVSEKEASPESVVEPETEALVVSSSEESLALQARMKKLEQQLTMMQKMLTLKDEQIAALQSQKKAAIAPEIKTKPEESTAEIKVEPKTEPLVEDVKPVIKTEPKAVVKPKEKPKAKPRIKPRLKPVVQPEPETGFMPDFITMVIGGLGAAILGVLGWLWWRKRKIEDETDTESMFASASEISLPDSSTSELSIPVMDDDTASYDVGTVGESSFLSEFTPSDFDAFDTDQNEVDPISEADVYLAYGRYQQAEDLMRQAIEEQPDRDECKLKLLEIFYANENKDAFEKYATELITAGKNDDQVFWLKVVEMGAELDPDSSLYTEQAGEKASFETEDSGVDESTATDNQSKEESVDSAESENEAEFDLSVFDEDKVKSEDEAEKTEDDSLDFDLSVFDLDDADASKTEGTESPADAEEMESVDFDLDSSVAEEPVKAEKKGEVEEIESLDFDLGASSEAESADDTIVLDSDVDTDESLENFDFSVDESVSAPETTESTSSSDEPETKEAENFETFDFDFETDEPTPPSAIESQHDLDEGVSDLTDMDELETKIDLAKAYVDMGDSEAAKNIAEEVLKRGNEEQKKAAQDIIDQL